MRIMGWDTVGLSETIRMRAECSTKQGYPALWESSAAPAHFDGVTYTGLEVAGEALGQHDATSNVAAAAIKANFIFGAQGFGFNNQHETHTSLGLETSGTFHSCKAKDRQKTCNATGALNLGHARVAGGLTSSWRHPLLVDSARPERLKLVNRRAGGVAAAGFATLGLVGGFFHTLAREAHVPAHADEGIAGTGQNGGSCKRDQQD